MHELGFVDSATPLSKAKPAGVLSCELRELILPVGSPAPVDANTMPFLANDSRAPTPFTTTAPMSEKPPTTPPDGQAPPKKPALGASSFPR